MSNIYSHSIEGKPWRLIKDHLYSTAIIAGMNASHSVPQLAELAYIAGLLHDAGKYLPKFADRLKGKPVSIDHSIVGAEVANQRYSGGKELLAPVIAGHHAGLPDYGSSEGRNNTLCKRLSKATIDEKLFEEVKIPDYFSLPGKTTELGLYFWAKFIFAFLVDADRLDAESFFDPERAIKRHRSYSIADLKNLLDSYIDNKEKSEKNIDRLRKEVLNECREAADIPPGFFSLTVPTGGGKTLSSMAFALNHCVKYKKDRVISAIPYTSIIEQNAGVYKEALGEENVLEHHSNLDFDDYGEPELAEKMKLSAEDWRSPVVMTTNVQFFESLFTRSASLSRKLASVANSVIILDEAQMIPTNFLKPCIWALIELVNNYNCTVVFCSATQPALSKLMKDISITEIVSEPEQLYSQLKRVDVHYVGKMNDEEIMQEMDEAHQAICIVNTRKHARLLYDRAKDKDNTFHLSTRMNPVTRASKLQEIKNKLRDGHACKVVSTQLVEAGVDIDFPIVYRSAAGLDSIAQAAGRCNREGEADVGNVYVFKPEEHGMPRGWLNRTASIGLDLLGDHDDPLAPKAIEDYFDTLYHIDAENPGVESIDKQEIISLIEHAPHSQRGFDFEEISNRFKLIDDNAYSVIVILDNNLDVITQIREGVSSRNLQRYGVKVYQDELDELIKSGYVKEDQGYYVLCHSGAYDKNIGLLFANEIDMETLIV